ncbi:hypothetical protein Bca4012_004392 [Brassica carinata]
MVDIPELENDDLLEENSLSVIVRCLNPSAHKVGGLVKALPPIWGLEDRVHGRGVGPDRVQFIFQSDRDLHHVLTRGPWIRGLPIHLLKEKAVDSLVGPLGEVEKVELHAKNSSSVDYVRAQVWIKADVPLQFRRIARFKTGEVIPTELEYERLIKVCFICKRLTHDQTRCPTQMNLLGREPPDRDEHGPERRTQRGLQGGSSSHKEVAAPTQARKTTTRRISKTLSQRKTVDLKGKGVAGGSTRVWKQKELTKHPREEGAISKSSGESSAPYSRKSSSGKKKNPQSRITPPKETNRELISVFERLSNAEDNQLDNTILLEQSDPNTSSSKALSTPKDSHEGRSSKGRRSPPSVFERLGSGSKNSSERKHNVIEVTSSKRRRLSHSGERESKKPRIEEQETSVFKRLGHKNGDSGEKNSESHFHSAQVAASHPPHSVRRIVLGSVRQLKEMLGQHSPEILFLSETKNKRRYLESLVESLGFTNLKTVEPIGRGGGLAVFWKEACRVEVLQAHRRVIDMKIHWQDKIFFLSCIYGEPVKGKRNEVWERLTRIGTKRKGPWIMTGDFNEMIDPSEKLGGAARDIDEGKEFRQMLHANGLWNIKHFGYQFSWAGTRNNENVQCRLDRTVANKEWLDMFPQASATYLQKVCSDHSPILTTLVDQIRNRRACFKYDHRWIHREGFSSTFETDSLVLAKMINGKEETWPKLKPIIQEITHSLSTNRSYRVEYFAHEEADMPSLGSNYDVGPNNVG